MPFTVCRIMKYLVFMGLGCYYLGVVIGAPLSDLITIEAGNIWDKLFLSRRFLIWHILATKRKVQNEFFEKVPLPPVSRIFFSCGAKTNIDSSCICIDDCGEC